MNILESPVFGYFESPQQAQFLLYVVCGALGVAFDGGRRRLNRLEFIGAAGLILLLSAGTGLVVRAAIPKTPALPAWAQQSPVPPPPAGYTLDRPPQQPGAAFDPTTAVPVEPQQQPDAGSRTSNPFDRFDAQPSMAQQPNTGPNNGWVLMLAGLGRVAALGYGVGLVAMARCRDSREKNEMGHAIAVVVFGAIIPLGLAYPLLLGETKKKSDERRTGTPGLNTKHEAPAISGRNTLDDPIVIPESLIPASQDYVSMEYAYIGRVHSGLKEEWKLKSQYLLSSNGRYLDKIIVYTKAFGRPEWDRETEYYFDVTAPLKNASSQSYRSSRAVVG